MKMIFKRMPILAQEPRQNGIQIFPPIPPWVFIGPGAGVLGDVDLDGISVHRFSFAVHAFLGLSMMQLLFEFQNTFVVV